jgi:organic hydroperoxide reductase OsmC/OhrA
MSMAPFPHQYTVSFAAGELVAPPRAAIRAGAPPQFGGRDDVWSPEQLLLGAALLCLQTTFAAYAAHNSLGVYDWRATATGTLDKGTGGPVFTSIRLAVELETDAGDQARARELFATAERHCIISRALNVRVDVAATVRAREARAAG